MVTLADILQVELEGLNTHLIKIAEVLESHLLNIYGHLSNIDNHLSKIAQVLDKRLDDIDKKLNRLVNK